MKIKTCPICGKEFESFSTAICCSEDCARERSRRCQRERYIKKKKRYLHPEEGKRKTCPICGKMFFPISNQIYCSKECATVSYNNYHAEYQKKHREEILIKDRLRHRREKQLHYRTCPECGRYFVTENALKLFCCRNCKDRWNSKPEGDRIDRRVVSAEEAARRMREAQEKKLAEEERRNAKYQNGPKRTESGAVWYPVSGVEIQRIARETHRTYGEVCAEFLSKQVKCGE